MACRIGVVASVLLIVALGSAQRPSQCSDGAGRPGNCVPLRFCTPLFTAFRRDRTAASSFLRRSHCGFQVNEPKVCCAYATSESSRGIARSTGGGGGGVGGGFPPTQQPPRGNRGSGPKSQSLTSLLPAECGRQSVTYIVGGTNTSLGEHPWLVGLEYLTYKGRQVLCGGTLISARYVLTAAHCVRTTSNERLQSVVLGEHDLSTEKDCEVTTTGQVCAPPVQRSAIERSIKHPGYTETGDRHNDIALLRLSQPAQISPYVIPVCLPGVGEARSLTTTRHTVVGWGRTETSWKSNLKQKVTVPVIENSLCSELYKQRRVNLAPTQVCAGGEQGRDSCSGDSGGPLLVSRNEVWVLDAVVSIGPEVCGTANQPGIYTRVAPYVSWITETLQP